MIPRIISLALFAVQSTHGAVFPRHQVHDAAPSNIPVSQTNTPTTAKTPTVTSIQNTSNIVYITITEYKTLQPTNCSMLSSSAPFPNETPSNSTSTPRNVSSTSQTTLAIPSNPGFIGAPGASSKPASSSPGQLPTSTLQLPPLTSTPTSTPSSIVPSAPTSPSSGLGGGFVWPSNLIQPSQSPKATSTIPFDAPLRPTGVPGSTTTPSLSQSSTSVPFPSAPLPTSTPAIVVVPVAPTPSLPAIVVVPVDSTVTSVPDLVVTPVDPTSGVVIEA